MENKVSFGASDTPMIVGRWKVKFDERGRFQIPTGVREYLKKYQPSSESACTDDGEDGELQFYICKGFDKPLQLFTIDHFTKMVNSAVCELEGEDLDKFLIQIGSSSYRVTTDKGGRANIPDYLLKDAKFKIPSEVILVGKVYFLEIWHDNSFEERLEGLRNDKNRMNLNGKILSTLPKADWHCGRTTSRSSRCADSSTRGEGHGAKDSMECCDDGEE